MEPLITNGTQVTVEPTSDIAVGDVIVAKHPYKKIDVIKQVSAVDNGRYTLSGLGPDSTDSQNFGLIRKRDIIGKVIQKPA